jgi:H+/Cl- antiporter ClcA
MRKLNLAGFSSLAAKWIFIYSIIAILSGSSSAFFLVALDWVTQYREQNHWVIGLLPIGGLIIGLLYQFYGSDVIKGTNIILEEYEKPEKVIPFKMAPMILASTLITHVLGGSAGREGTAVQMSVAISDQFRQLLNLTDTDRKTILILGISAGFAGIFGTPLAGALFALEVVFFSKINIKSIILSFIVAYSAHFVVVFWEVPHTRYQIPFVPEFTVVNFCWTVATGFFFGLTSMLFSRTSHMWTEVFARTIKKPFLRPFLAGIVLAALLLFTGNTKYIGLGIPEIVASFSITNAWYDFLIKIIITGFTLGSGFKGGEVTPLFFIGATLGSALSLIIPLPIALLAGMGFVAVFSGATHTPIACTVMGIELFGIQSGIFISVACLIAYYCSGSTGIYKSQIVKGSKQILYSHINRLRNTPL